MKEEHKNGGLELVFVHRMSLWLWLSLALLLAIHRFAPHMVSVVLYKVALITIGGYVGFVLSLALEGALGFRRAPMRYRPHEYQAMARACRAEAQSKVIAARAELLALAWQYELLALHMLWRRAGVVAAVLIASALGS